jgi:2-iminobutanoate/2-iminopropanoate deaminase
LGQSFPSEEGQAEAPGVKGLGKNHDNGSIALQKDKRAWRKREQKKGTSMKKIIQTEKAPKAVGPYSQAIQAGNFVFTSGQIGLDPATGKLVKGGIREQARQVMENLSAVLEAANSDFSRVVKTTVFLREMNDFMHFNEVYGEYFPSDRPARSTFQVAALPLGAVVEIEMIALAAD